MLLSQFIPSSPSPLCSQVCFLCLCLHGYPANRFMWWFLRWPSKPHSEKQIRRSVKMLGDFPGSPVVKTLPSNAGGVGWIPVLGVKIPCAWRPKNQNINNRSNICNIQLRLKKKNNKNAWNLAFASFSRLLWFINLLMTAFLRGGDIFIFVSALLNIIYWARAGCVLMFIQLSIKIKSLKSKISLSSQ